MISAFEGRGNTYEPVRIHACRTHEQSVTKHPIRANLYKPNILNL
jgi:hypothetical protein